MSSKKYRKLPVVIEALQWNGTWEQCKKIHEFTNYNSYETSDMDFKRSYLWIKTLEGDHMVTPRDYIIKGIKGEFYPCKSDVFLLSYEEVGDDKN